MPEVVYTFCVSASWVDDNFPFCMWHPSADWALLREYGALLREYGALLRIDWTLLREQMGLL